MGKVCSGILLHIRCKDYILGNKGLFKLFVKVDIQEIGLEKVEDVAQVHSPELKPLTAALRIKVHGRTLYSSTNVFYI